MRHKFTILIFLLFSFISIPTNTLAFEIKVNPYAVYNLQDRPLADNTFDELVQYDYVILNTDNTLNTTTKLKAINPDINILNYRQIMGIPAYPGSDAALWGSKARTDNLHEWQQANLYEDLFHHSAEPATLTVRNTPNGDTLFWSTDKRTLAQLALYPNATYTLWGSNTIDEPYTKLRENMPHTQRQHIQTSPLYQYYKLTTTLPDGTQLDYSDPVTASTQNQILYQDFTITCTDNIQPWPTYDCFHLEPNTQLNVTFTTIIRQPDNVASAQIYYTFDGNNNFFNTPDTNDNTPILNLTRIGTTNEFTGSIQVNKTEASESGGIAYFINVTYTDDSTEKFPLENVFTTNINNRIRRVGWGNYLPKMNERYKDITISDIQYKKHTYGFTGIYIDLVDLNGQFGYKAVDAKPQALLNVDTASDAYLQDFFLAKYDLYQQLRQTFPQDPIIFNNYTNRQDTIMPNQPDPLDFINGDKLEGFVIRTHDDPNRKNDWLEDMNNYIDLQNRGKVVFAQAKPYIISIPNSTQEEYLDSANDWWFSVGSYLLGQFTENTYYNVWGRGAINPHEPEYDLNMGEAIDPLGGNIPLNTLEVDPGVYLRKFQKGTIIVNTLTQPITPVTYISDLNDSTYQVLAFDRNPSNLSREIINPISVSSEPQIPPRTARIYVNQTFSLTPTPTNTPSTLLDANSDQQIDILDLALWKNAMAGKNISPHNADFNADGKINQQDADEWIQYRQTQQ